MDTIQNWYENIVHDKLSQLARSEAHSSLDATLWNDVACLALNHLPPRYVRHTVDMTFYMSPQEQLETDRKIDTAIQNALLYVKQHPSHSRKQKQSAA